MHRNHAYGLAFLAVLVAAAAGFLGARRLVGPIELPSVDVSAQAQALLGAIDVNALIPRRTPQPLATPSAASGPTLTPGRILVEPPTTSATAPPVDLAGSVASTTTLSPPGATPAGLEIAAVTSTQEPLGSASAPVPTPTLPQFDPGSLFTTAGSVRHSTSECPGASILGVVRDASGAPLTGIRLWRYDQWGNEQVVESKASEVDAGQYDFPLGDTPNVHYVQVIDSGGVIISPVIEIQHRQGDAPDAVCHWLDWVRR